MKYTCHTCLLDLRDRSVAFNAHQADWWPSSSEDCIFVAWQVDAQLLPRCLKRCPFFGEQRWVIGKLPSPRSICRNKTEKGLRKDHENRLATASFSETESDPRKWKSQMPAERVGLAWEESITVLFLFSYSPDFLDRTAGFTADGLYEEAAPGEDWVTKCLLCAYESVHILRLLMSDLWFLHIWHSLSPDYSVSTLDIQIWESFRYDRNSVVCASGLRQTRC